MPIADRIPIDVLLEEPELVRITIEGFFNRHSIGAILAALSNDEEALINILANKRGISPDKVLIELDTPLHSKNAQRHEVKERNSYMTKAINTFLINAMPTPETYARAVGFSSFKSLIAAAENNEYPEESRHYLVTGCSVIADLYTRAGMMDRMNTQFTKFIMSAALGINEKVETKTEIDNRVTISWGQNPNDPNTPALGYKNDPTLIELDRLESALPKNMSLATTQSPMKSIDFNPVTISDLM